jgi:hypothetical protein
MSDEMKLGEPKICPVCNTTHPDGVSPVGKMLKEKDDRPQKDWWAPGNYFCRCTKCNNNFLGDKRAGTCAPCAYGDKK